MSEMDPALQLVLQQLSSGQQQIQADISSVKTEISSANTTLAVISERVSEKRLADIETRLRASERFRYTWAGVSTIVSLLLGFVGYWIGHIVK